MTDAEFDHHLLPEITERWPYLTEASRTLTDWRKAVRSYPVRAVVEALELLVRETTRPSLPRLLGILKDRTKPEPIREWTESELEIRNYRALNPDSNLPAEKILALHDAQVVASRRAWCEKHHKIDYPHTLVPSLADPTTAIDCFTGAVVPLVPFEAFKQKFHDPSRTRKTVSITVLPDPRPSLPAGSGRTGMGQADDGPEALWA